MVYVVLVDRLEQRVLAERMVCAVLKAAGADVDLPDLESAREEFDAALVAEPERVDPEREVLLRGLGLRARAGGR